jgi:hypothetical protein
MLVWPLDQAVKIALSAVLVAVILVLVFVAHPRRWWMNRAFDVEGFIEDDLCPRVRDAAAVLKAAATAKGAGKAGAKVTIDADSKIVVKPNDAQAKSMSLRDFVLSTLPAAAHVGDPHDFGSETLSTRVIDMADPKSVERGTKEPIALLLAQCGRLAGTPFADRVLRGQTPLCMAMDKAALSAVRANMAIPDLSALVAKNVPEDDPGAALLLACMEAESDDAAWALMRAELDGVIAVCAAVAELRHAYVAVFPQLRRMRMDRRMDMDLVEVFRLFNRPYLQEFVKNYNKAVKDFETTSDAIKAKAERTVQSIKRSVKANIEGKKYHDDIPPQDNPGPEGFKQRSEPIFAPIVRSTIFGVHVDENGREVIVEEMSIGSFFKMVGNIFKLLPKILNGIGDIIEGVVLIFMAILRQFKELQKGVLNFIIKLIILSINCVIFIFVLMAAPIMATILWFWMAVVPLLLKLWFFGIILVQACFLNLIMAFMDTVTQGAMRHLALSEDHPEAWFRTSGAQSGNGVGRFFGTLFPCSDGYAPGMLPPYCQKVSRCVPLSSPAAMLANRLRSGRLASLLSGSTLYGHPFTPSGDVACTRLTMRYRAEAASDVIVNGFTVPADAIQEISLASCMGRMAGATPLDTCRVCKEAITGKHRDAASTSAVAFGAAVSSVRRPMKGSTKAVVAVFLAVALASTARFVRASGNP